MKLVWALLALFVVLNTAYLHRVPGLMGDEASEGENVFELWSGDKQFYQGERSYIGPFMDYVRMPFIKIMGATPLALRVPMLLVSIATFWLAWLVLRRLFGDEAGLLGAIIMLFSPVYIAHQRLAWAITLAPLLALIAIYLLTGNNKHKALLAGLALGLGIHNHILFVPAAAAIAVIGALSVLLGFDSPPLSSRSVGDRFKRLLSYWPAVIGLAAAISTQAVTLVSQTDDQGDPGAVASAAADRIYDLPKLLPLIMSGSSYVAHYTGQEFLSLAAVVITIIIALLIVMAAVFSRRRSVVLAWLLGLVVHLAVLLVLIDRYSLRYFVVFVLGSYVLAGVGLAAVMERVLKWNKKRLHIAALATAAGLSLAAATYIFIPFLNSGGSLAAFSLGNRTDVASALVDVRPLLKCLQGVGPVGSENVHIFNRLQFLSHEYPDLQVAPEEEIKNVKWRIHYRAGKEAQIPLERQLCPGLDHFIVESQTLKIDSGRQD